VDARLDMAQQFEYETLSELDRGVELRAHQGRLKLRMGSRPKLPECLIPLRCYCPRFSS
jgi:hypothetical protein